MVLRNVKDMDQLKPRKLDSSLKPELRNKSDDVSFIGHNLALHPSRGKSRSGTLSQSVQLIGLILAHQ